jgi:hypothetical protein
MQTNAGPSFGEGKFGVDHTGRMSFIMQYIGLINRCKLLLCKARSVDNLPRRMGQPTASCCQHCRNQPQRKQGDCERGITARCRRTSRPQMPKWQPQSSSFLKYRCKKRWKIIKNVKKLKKRGENKSV